MLSVEERKRFDLWNLMMEDFGCPNVINKNGQLSSGAYLSNGQVDIGYMLAPMAINELLNATKDKIQQCALTKICRAFTEGLPLMSCVSQIPERKPMSNGYAL